jgi:hypothetical protein
MKIHFCDLCNESVPQSDLDQGRARLVKDRVICSTCERAMSLASASAGARVAEPFSAADPAPAAYPPAAPLSAEHAAIAPAVPGTASGGSGVAWMAAAGLLATAIVVYVFEQRVDRLAASDLELAHTVELARADVRGIEARLARLPAETAELERRLSEGLKDALATSEQQRTEMAAATERAERTLAELQRAQKALRKDLDELALAREQRLDELSHRLAQNEDAQRALTGRLSQYQESAESARAAADALAKALPEKQAAAPAGPAWLALLPNLGDANPSTRWEAVDELGRSKDPAAVPHVIPLLRDSDLFVRMCAARVLADLGTLQGVPSLIDALEDAEPTVRESAWNALRTLTGKDLKFDTQANEAERQKKVKLWREWWKKEGEGLLNGAGGDPEKPIGVKSGTQKS